MAPKPIPRRSYRSSSFRARPRRRRSRARDRQALQRLFPRLPRCRRSSAGVARIANVKTTAAATPNEQSTVVVRNGGPAFAVPISAIAASDAEAQPI